MFGWIADLTWKHPKKVLGRGRLLHDPRLRIEQKRRAPPQGRRLQRPGERERQGKEPADREVRQRRPAGDHRAGQATPGRGSACRSTRRLCSGKRGAYRGAALARRRLPGRKPARRRLAATNRPEPQLLAVERLLFQQRRAGPRQRRRRGVRTDQLQTASPVIVGGLAAGFNEVNDTVQTTWSAPS